MIGSHKGLLGWWNQGVYEGCVVLRLWGRRELYKGLWWRKLKERDHMEDERLRRGLGDNIVTEVREIGREDVDGINVAQDVDSRQGRGGGL